MDPTFTELAANIEAKWQASFAGSLQTLDVDQVLIAGYAFKLTFGKYCSLTSRSAS